MADRFVNLETLSQLSGGPAVQRARDRLVERLRLSGIRDDRVLEVLRYIPRHLFMDEALEHRAYEDTALPIGLGQTISQPYMVAQMTELLLEDKMPDKVLEVGTGSGYQTAVLATLVPRVHTVERIAALLKSAQERLRRLGLRNIRYKHTDGSLGLPEYAPFDAILVTAAPKTIPLELVQQLAVGGRMVLPAGHREEQRLLRLTRTVQGYGQEVLEPVVFVPLLPGKI